jgi:hypothetical protein
MIMAAPDKRRLARSDTCHDCQRSRLSMSTSWGSLMMKYHLSQVGLIRPSQHLGAMCSVGLSGEQRLMQAVLIDAFNVLRNWQAGSIGRRSFVEAVQWVTTRGTCHLFSFDSVCDALGIDSEVLRSHLRVLYCSHDELSGSSGAIKKNKAPTKTGSRPLMIVDNNPTEPAGSKHTLLNKCGTESPLGVVSRYSGSEPYQRSPLWLNVDFALDCVRRASSFSSGRHRRL